MNAWEARAATVANSLFSGMSARIAFQIEAVTDGRCIFTASYAVANKRIKMAAPGVDCEIAVRRICNLRTSATAASTGL